MFDVILVEDEELLRTELSLTTPWENLNCRLAGQAENGIAGLALIRDYLPSIIITDIRMPGMDGLKMLEAVYSESHREYYPSVLILTGHSDFEYARKAIRLGVKDYLLKPIDDGEFNTTLLRISSALSAGEARGGAGENGGGEECPPLPFQEYLPSGTADSGAKFAAAAVGFISENFCRDISISQAAGILQITDGYLSRIFKKETGYTFLEYLTNFRLNRALNLMRTENLKVNEIARKSGFRDAGYFSQIFRRYVGVSPARYKAGCLETFRST